MTDALCMYETCGPTLIEYNVELRNPKNKFMLVRQRESTNLMHLYITYRSEAA